MTTDVYKKLAQFLDNLPPGYPPTDSGVELRILRRLFTPKEAELALSLSLIAEEARVIARRAKISVAEATQRLEEMERKGLIFALHKEGKPPRYLATPYVIGFYEFQVNRLSPEFVEDFEEYIEAAWDNDLWQKSPQMRTIPVKESINVQNEVMLYEQAEKILRRKKKFVITPCVCRQEQQIVDKGCKKPMETCLSFGSAAEYYQRNGLGREITLTEALDILKEADRAGLVLQPTNSQDPGAICACCGCCCGVLRNIKRHPQPASIVSSPFLAALDNEYCILCGECEERCQMEAIYEDDGAMVLNVARCIGCGLCVTTCPSNALSLVRKPESEQAYVPRNSTEAGIKLGQARGKLGMGEMVKMAVKSKVDRLLAAK